MQLLHLIHVADLRYPYDADCLSDWFVLRKSFYILSIGFKLYTLDNNLFHHLVKPCLSELFRVDFLVNSTTHDLENPRREIV